MPLIGRGIYEGCLYDDLRGDAGEHQQAMVLGCLPPTTLDALLAVPPGRLGSRLRGHKQRWAAALDRMIDRSDGERSVLEGVEQVAFHLLFGHVPAAVILEMFQTHLHFRWQFRSEDDADVQALQELVDVLRLQTNAGAIDAFLAAIARVRQALQRSGGDPNAPATNDRLKLPRWALLENVLYHHVFSWPLLVIRHDACELPVSLPVEVQVHFDGRGRANQPEFHALNTIRTDGWPEAIATSMKAAKTLYSQQFGFDGAFAREVAEASVVLDFSAAEEIALPARLAKEQVTLGDRSMEAYFAQVILSRFVGSRLVPAKAATGVISGPARRPYGSARDFEVAWPGGVKSKVSFVMRSGLFERVVLPAVTSRKVSETSWPGTGSRKGLSVEVNFAATLSNFADSFQIVQWRRSRFIRTPDLQWDTIHHGQEFRVASARDCLNDLLASKDCVLEVPQTYSAASVLSALRLADKVWKTGRLRVDTVRAVPDERGDRFWYLQWRLWGGTLQDFERLQKSSVDDAAFMLAERLNRTQPTVTDTSPGAPQVLVIVGWKRLVEEPDGQLSAGRLRLDAVLSCVRAHARQERLPFGTIPRILLVDEPSAAPWMPPDSEAHRALLLRLGVFRFGFTQQMASAVDGRIKSPEDLRRALTDLVSRGLLRKVHAEYFVPQIGGVGHARGTPIERATLHYRAALAYAPYLPFSFRGSVDLYRAFETEFVHEAQHHIDRAVHYTKLAQSQDRNWNSRIAGAQFNLTRWYDVREAPSIRRLSEQDTSGKAGWNQAKAILATHDSSHPLDALSFLEGARAGVKRWTGLVNDQAFQGDTAVLRREVIAAFEDGLKSAGAGRAERLSLLTAYGAFLYRHGANAEESERAEELRAEILDFRTPDGALAEWFELAGDREVLDGEAVELYQRGAYCNPENFATWVKYCGSSGKSSANLEIIVNEIAGLLRGKTKEQLNQLRAWLSWPKRFAQQSPFAHVQERIRRGEPVLHKILSAGKPTA